MTEEKNNRIDDLFREGLSQDTPPFREEYWQGFEQMLGEVPPPPGPPPAAASGIGSILNTALVLKGIGGIAILAALGTGMYFLTGSGDENSSEDRTEYPLAMSGDNDVFTITEKEKTDQETGKSNNGVAEISGTHETETDEVITGSKTLRLKDDPLLQSQRQNKTGSSVSSGPGTKKSGKITSTGQGQAAALPQPSEVYNPAATPSEKQDNSSSSMIKPEGKAYKQDGISETAKNTGNQAPLHSIQAGTEKTAEPGLTPAPGNAESPSGNPPSDSITGEISSPGKPSVSPERTDSMAENTPLPLPASPAKDPLNYRDDARFRLFLSPGLVLHPAFGNTTDFSNKQGMNLFLAAGMTLQIQEDLSVYAELSYMQTSGNELSRTLSRREYLYDPWTLSINLENRSFTWLQLPVMLRYTINRHSVGLGPSVAYLISSQGELSGTLLNQNGSGATHEKADNYLKGIQRLHGGVSLEYAYTFYRHHAALIRYTRYFNDLSKEEYYGGESDDQLYFLLFALRFRIF